MFRNILVAASTFALFAITACSSEGAGSASGEDELRGKTCGGKRGLQCPSGKTCQLDGDYPDATGRCVSSPGQMCGGIAGLGCPAGQRCRYEGNFPDAAGTCEATPAPGKEGGMCGGIAGFQCDTGLHCEYSSGPPPGAVGMPTPNDDDGMPPGAVGLPAPARDAGAGMPPGAVGMPAYPDQSGTCVRNDPNASFCARARCAAGTTCNEAQRACVPNTGNFCARARCASGTECNEAQRACVPYVCPPAGTIDCEPGGPLPKACSGNYHTWIIANCPGVVFAL